MHSILVTYDTRQGLDVGEAGCSLPICNEIYEQLLNNEHDIEHNLIEPALICIEQLRGRCYVPGSVKDIRLEGE
ncbi:MAG: hypothetical protein ACI4XW_11790 [Candidatus Spyradocola sp.]